MANWADLSYQMAHLITVRNPHIDSNGSSRMKLLGEIEAHASAEFPVTTVVHVSMIAARAIRRLGRKKCQPPCGSSQPQRVAIH